jgi:hypothetical protein
MSDDELLSPHPWSANDRLRAEILASTARRVRNVRRLRIAARIGVCIACFTAGAAAMKLRPVASPAPTYVYVEVEARPASRPDAPPPRSSSPAQLELEAEKAIAKAESARRFREAGDLYLRDFADYRSALRCYRNFLDVAEAGDLVVTPDDTWLLTSLKRAREQENTQ